MRRQIVHSRLGRVRTLRIADDMLSTGVVPVKQAVYRRVACNVASQPREVRCRLFAARCCLALRARHVGAKLKNPGTTAHVCAA